MFVKLGLLFFSFLGAVSWQEEIKEIDKQIEDLKDLQDKIRSNAQRQINNAMRWQFQNENYLDARRAWDKVAEDKQKIQELQDQIDDLEAKRKKILQEHGTKSSSS